MDVEEKKEVSSVDQKKVVSVSNKMRKKMRRFGCSGILSICEQMIGDSGSTDELLTALRIAAQEIYFHTHPSSTGGGDEKNINWDKDGDPAMLKQILAKSADKLVSLAKASTFNRDIIGLFLVEQLRVVNRSTHDEGHIRYTFKLLGQCGIVYDDTALLKFLQSAYTSMLEYVDGQVLLGAVKTAK